MSKMLPRPITGSVISGNHIGSTLGMPTANINPAPGETDGLVCGVYLSRVELEGRTYKGITNFGKKPSVHGGLDSPNLETYIYDFSGDIYGKTITVTLLEFLRPERRFGSLEELKAAMTADMEMARRL